MKAEAESYIGTCSECGEEDVEVFVIDDETVLCEDCLDEQDYCECDRCHEFYRWGCIDFYGTKDGKELCEFCAEALLEDKEVAEDDLERLN